MVDRPIFFTNSTSYMLINLVDWASSFIIVLVGHLAKDLKKSPDFNPTKIEYIATIGGKSINLTLLS